LFRSTWFALLCVFSRIQRCFHSLNPLLVNLLSYVYMPPDPAAFFKEIGDIASNTTFLASVYPQLLQLFRAEAQLPQRVSVMPFPTTAFTFNPFFTFTADVRPALHWLNLCGCAGV
jgi:hypothetical protein